MAQADDGSTAASDALLDVAWAAFARAGWTTAQELSRTVLTQRPDEADALLLAALLAARSGDLEQAGTLAAAARTGPARRCEAWRRAGAALEEMGLHDLARDVLRRALCQWPAAPGLWYALGHIVAPELAQQSLSALERTVRLVPELVAAWSGLAACLLAAGRTARGGRAAERAIALAPEQPLGYRQAAGAALIERDYAHAGTCLVRALRLNPAAVGLDTLCQVADVLQRIGRLDLASRLARLGLEQAPGQPDLALILANAAALGGDPGRALTGYRAVLTRHPGHALALNALAVQTMLNGDPAAAARLLARARRLAPANAVVHSNLLLAQQYLPEADPAHDRLDERHRAWDAAHGAAWRSAGPAWRRHRRDPADLPGRPAGRPLRIGYLSPDFRRHPVGFFLRHVIAAHDPAQVAVTCYADLAQEDAMTAAIRQAAPRWVACRHLDAAGLVDQIVADGIDILVDLAGHMSGNRLPVFAAKPAPVQATWAGYVGTTGVSAIDYLISDRHHTPPDAAEDNGLGSSELGSVGVERVIRLPDGYVCYAPPADAPEIGPLPAERNGHVTLGSFNNLAKLSPATLDLWAALLRGRDDRRLRLQTAALDVPEVRQSLAAALVQRGVQTGQFDLVGGAGHRHFLAGYNEVDIALDPLAYSGGLTTLEALWMGVPVVTLPGRRFCTRHSLSHLSTVGLAGLVATDTASYAALVDRLAGDRSRLAALRAELRQRLAGSPLCDADRFTRHLEAAFHAMWQQQRQDNFVKS